MSKIIVNILSLLTELATIWGIYWLAHWLCLSIGIAGNDVVAISFLTAIWAYYNMIDLLKHLEQRLNK